MFSEGHIGEVKSTPFRADKLLFTPQGPLLDKNKEEDKPSKGLGAKVGVWAEIKEGGKLHWNPLVHEIFYSFERKVNGKIRQIFWTQKQLKRGLWG